MVLLCQPRVTDRKEVESLHRWHVRRLREARPVTDTSRPDTLKFRHLQQGNAKGRAMQNGKIHRLQQTNSMLADRMVAIMAGETANTSHYHQNKFQEVTTRQQVFSYNARRRRRKNMIKIEVENERLSNRLCGVSSTYTQENLRPRMPLQPPSVHDNHRARTSPDHQPEPHYIPTGKQLKMDSPRPPEASGPSHPRGSASMHHSHRHMVRGAAMYSTVTESQQGSLVDAEDSYCLDEPFTLISPRLRRKPATTTAQSFNTKNVVARKIMKLDDRMVAAVVQRHGDDSLILHMVDLAKASSCAFALPDAELRMWTASWTQDACEGDQENEGNEHQHLTVDINGTTAAPPVIKRACPLSRLGTWLRILKCLTAWVPSTGGPDTADKIIIRPANDEETAGANVAKEGWEQQSHYYHLERIVCFGSVLAYSVVCKVHLQAKTKQAAKTRVQSLGFYFKALTVGGRCPSAADTRVECTEEATKSFAEYMDLPYEVERGRAFWEDLLDTLVAELYLWDRGDGRLVCAGPIYYFTAEETPSSTAQPTPTKEAAGTPATDD